MASVKRNLIYNTLLNISKVVFPLITAPYVTRVLDASDLGLSNFAGTYAGYFALVAVLGIPYYGAREIAKVRDDNQQTNRLFHELFSIAIINTFIITCIYLLSVLLIDQLSADYIVFLIVGIALYCSPFNIDWFYGGLESFKIITLRSLVIKTLSVISLFIFVKDRDDFIVYLCINSFATVANDIWNFILLYKLGYKIGLCIKNITKHIKPLLLLFASSLAVSIYTVLDTIMLGFMTAYVEVAYYTYAMHLVKTLLAAITSLSAVAVPRISYYIEHKLFDEINNLVNKSFSLVTFFALPMCVGIILISPTFIPLFLGEQFYGSVVPIQILSTVLIFIGLNNLSAVQCLVGLGYDNLFLYSVLAGTLSNFTLNCILIPSFGAIGASVASAIAELFVLLFSFYLVIKFTPIRLKIKSEFINTVIGSLLIVIEFFLVQPFVSGWVFIFIFAILASLSYLVYQYVFKNQTMLLLVGLLTEKIKK